LRHCSETLIVQVNGYWRNDWLLVWMEWKKYITYSLIQT